MVQSGERFAGARWNNAVFAILAIALMIMASLCVASCDAADNENAKTLELKDADIASLSEYGLNGSYAYDGESKMGTLTLNGGKMEVDGVKAIDVDSIKVSTLHIILHNVTTIDDWYDEGYCYGIFAATSSTDVLITGDGTLNVKVRSDDQNCGSTGICGKNITIGSEETGIGPSVNIDVGGYTDSIGILAGNDLSICDSNVNIKSSYAGKGVAITIGSEPTIKNSYVNLSGDDCACEKTITIADDWIVKGSKTFGKEPTETITEEITSDWKVVSIAPKDPLFTVSFQSDGKVEKYSQVASGKTVERYEPTKADYILLGWYLNGELYDFGTPVTKNITLVAKWQKIESKEEVVIDSKDSTVAEIDIAKTGVKNVTVEFAKAHISVNTEAIADKNLIVSVNNTTGDRYEVKTQLDDGAAYEGKITISLPYDKSKGTPVAYYYPSDGGKQIMDSTIDEASGMIVFTTTHNSEYGVEYSSQPGPADVMGPALIMLLALAFFAIIGTIMVSVYGRDSP